MRPVSDRRGSANTWLAELARTILKFNPRPRNRRRSFQFDADDVSVTANNYLSFADDLDLQPGADGLFVGKIRGFPVGLKFIDPPGGLLLLFQVRHWLMAEAPQLKTMAYDTEIKTLLAEKTLDIEFDDRIAWLSFSVGAERVESATVLRVLSSIMEAFESAGLIGDPDLCHYCQKEKVNSISSSDGKVAQICPTCLDERLGKRDREAAAPAAEAVPILLMSPAAAFIGAMLWAAIWAGHTVLFEHAGSGIVFIPRLVMVGVMVCVGFLVGGPVGWIIRQNRRRGHAASVSGAILFGSLAVIAGEILYLAWLIHHLFGVYSLSAALQAVPIYYGENDPIFLAEKALTAFISVAIAYVIAKPEAPRLKL
jgi:hypothetical protein